MPQTSVFDIYKASAGSGKTFSLTLHYLQLALEFPANYRRILAVTFTNKATAEMKERILEVLHGLATQSSEVQAYREALSSRLPHFDDREIHERARKVYTNILHDYSRFSVTTIDAFVQRIIRSFAWELGIDGGFKLQLSADPVKEDLAERLYLRLDDDKDLQQWVVDMAMERLQDGKRWEFREDMLKLADELFKERFKDFEAAIGIYDADEVQQRFSTINKQVNATVKGIEKKWQDEGEAVVKLLQMHGLDKEDFHYGKGGFINYFFKVAAGELTEPSSRVNEILSQPNKMAGKHASPEARESIQLISDQIHQSLSRLAGWYAGDIYDYNTAKAIRQNLSFLRLMRVFAEELGAYRKENNALLISDTHFLLKKLTEDTSASFIYEKTGQRYQHYLIDEFQDTSAFQWNNFLPLLTEALGNGNYNLVVGDVKQAIYRWRNGDWRLLLREVEKQLKPFGPQVKTLQENYRSARQVIQFNNLLFHLAPQLLQGELNAALNRADESALQALLAEGYGSVFNDAYADSFQQVPSRSADNGLVHLQWLKEEEDVSFEEQVLPKLYEKVQQLFDEGFGPADIAVLTRTNKEAQVVVEYLVGAQEEGQRRFNVISGDALMLSGNQAVQIIISAMRWLHNSKHTIAMAQLRQLVLLQRGIDANRLEVFATNGDNSILPPMLLSDRIHLRSLPLTELLHQLIMLFELQQWPHHAPYLLALADKVQEWTRYGETSLQEFLQYWDDEGLKFALPAKAGNDAIEVVTIHKSKGLAYQIVLMPFLDWELVPKGGPMAPTLWVNNEDTAFNEIAVLPVQYKKDLAQSAYAAEYYEELVLTAMDNLNVLYVAFTRARQRLYGWAPQSEKKSSNKQSDAFAYKHIGELLRAVATGNATLPGAEYVDVRSGWNEEENSLVYGVESASNNTGQSAQEKQVPVLTYTDWRDKLNVRYQALTSEAETEVVLPRQQGILLHEILGRLELPGQLMQVLAQVKREGWFDEYQQRKISGILEDVLSMEVLQPWASGVYQRLAERSIINKDRKLRRPDLILYNDAQCLVYDFKFTAGDNDQKKHEIQIREYMEMLMQMGFQQVKGFVIYGLEKKAITIE